jgi:hypothetical protein
MRRCDDRCIAVEIAVQERTPTMLVRIEGRLFLADEQGIVIDGCGPAYSSFDLPIVDGIRRLRPPGASLDLARTRWRFARSPHCAVRPT